nr:TolC family outer membrane protein [Motiliproteus sp. SC1-56]
METAVFKTIDGNPEIGAVLDQYHAREDAIGVARSGYLPRIDLEGGYGWEETDTPGLRARGDHPEELTRQELSLNLRQMLFDGFRTPSDVARASAEAEAHRYLVQAEAEDLALRTAEVYLAVLQASEELALAEENLKAHERIHSQIKQRTDQGIGSSSELDQAEGRLARAHSNRVAAANNLADAQRNFEQVVGEMPTDLQRPENGQLTLPASLADAEAQAQQQHPTLMAARLDVEAASEQIDVFKSRNYPQLSFEVNSSWGDDFDGIKGHNNDARAMLKLRYNLFSGFEDTHETARAVHQREEAREVLERAARQVKEGLGLAWNAHRFLDEQQPYLKRHVEASASTLEAYTKQFELGRRTLMDLLDMENERFEAEKALLRGRTDLVLARYRVLNATGSLLESLSVEAPSDWPVAMN